MPFRVVIIGAGLAGSLLANGLIREHVDVQVYERSERHSKREGLQIRLTAPALSGMRACLTKEHLQNIIQNFGPATEAKAEAPRVMHKDWSLLLDLSKFPAYGKNAPINRGLLRDLLADPVYDAGKLKYGADLERYEVLHAGTDQEKIRAWLGDGPLAVSQTHGDGRSSGGQEESLAKEADDTLHGHWPVSEIIGEEITNGELYYLIRWEDTLEPARNVAHLKAVVKEWNKEVMALREKLHIPSATADTHVNGRSSLDRGENLSNKLDDIMLYQWPVSIIVGEEVYDGELHYLMRWEDSLEPASNIVQKGLVQDWNTTVKELREDLRSPSGTKRPRGAASDAGRTKKSRHLSGNSSF